MSYHTNYSGIRLHCLSVMIPNTQGLENGVYGSAFCFTQFQTQRPFRLNIPVKLSDSQSILLRRWRPGFIQSVSVW